MPAQKTKKMKKIPTKEKTLTIEDVTTLNSGLDDIKEATKLDIKASYRLGRLHDKVGRIVTKSNDAQKLLSRDGYSEVIDGEQVPVYKKQIEYIQKLHGLNQLTETLEVPLFDIGEFEKAEISFGSYVRLKEILKERKPHGAPTQEVECTGFDVGRAMDGLGKLYKKTIDGDLLLKFLDITDALLPVAKEYYNKTNEINWRYTEINDNNVQVIAIGKTTEYNKAIEACNNKKHKITVPELLLDELANLGLPPLFYSGMGIFLTDKE